MKAMTADLRGEDRRGTDTEFGNEVDLSAAVAERLTITVPLVIRNSLSLGNPQLYGLGPFFELEVTKHLTLTGGYLFVGLPNAGPGYKVNVPLAAITLRGALGRVQISDRNRMEVLIGLPNDPVRYRNKFVVNLPLAQGRWLPFLSDEAFYDFSQSAWSQNRFQAGLGRELAQRFRVDVFYLQRNSKGNPAATHAIGMTIECKFTRKTTRSGVPHEEN